jgi:serine/threonine protein kinase
MSSARRRFRIIKEIAEGGFGKVYLAEQISSDGFSRIVAVKLLHAKWSSHDEVVMRTRDEARLLGLIRHQHIVKVEDLTSIDGKCAIVMEYLEGCDLKWMMTFLKERDLEFPRAALFEIVLASASALDAAYNGRPLQGGEPLRVIHRDIKPSNVFVTVAGGVKVLDFGTARANFAEREAKTQALAFGSQGYMAPERMLGEEDTPAADIFSLGIALYELLALDSFGRIPPRPNKFLAKVEDKVAGAPIHGDDEWVEQIRDVLLLMLSYDPCDRPTAAQVVEIFEVLAQNSSDMGLRRFCRTLVAEAKANEPELDAADPLAGTVVDEDASASFGVSAGGVPQPQNLQAPGTEDLAPPPMPTGLPGAGIGLAPPPVVSTSPPPPQNPPPQVGQPTAPPSLPPQQHPGHQSLPNQPAVDSTLDYHSEEDSGGGSKMLLIVGALVVVIIVIGVVVVLGGSGIAALFLVRTEPTVVEQPKPMVPDIPEPVEPALVGGKVLSPDKRADIKKAATTLKFSDSNGGKVTITGGEGFKAEWDGKSPFEIGELGDGRYSTIIEPANGKKIRGKSFTIEGKRKNCEFTFELEKKAWEGSCK